MLTSLARQYGTDKLSHGFISCYENAFDPIRTNVKKVLEVGVFFGSSINMWKDYFPSAVIYGLDHFEGLQGNGSNFSGFLDYYNKCKQNPDPRIQLYKVNQSKEEELKQFVNSQTLNSFDVILDDGSHLMHDQQITLGMLWPLVKSGGYFVVEDLHTSFENGYDVRPDGLNRTYDMLARFNTNRSLWSMYLELDVLRKIESEIDTIVLYNLPNGSRTGLIKKKINPNQN